MRGFHCIVLSVALAGGGCARGGDPVDMTRFLRVGVDVPEEAEAVVRSLSSAGYDLVARVDGEGVVALGFANDDGATAVRVVTGRGIAFGMDGYPDGLRATVPLHVALVGEGLAGRDWTGDGHPELFVAVHGVGRTHPCVAVLRVAEGGFVVEMPQDTGAAVGEVCAEAVRPLPDAARPSLKVVERHEDLLPIDPPPRVSLALVPREGRWAPVPGDHASWDAHKERRQAEDARDVEAVRVAVELAAIERLRGEGKVAQVEAFDAHMRGRVLSEAVAGVSDCARAHLLAGWPQPAAPCYTPEPHGP